jgi:glucose-6-phosphate isomerase
MEMNIGKDHGITKEEIAGLIPKGKDILKDLLEQSDSEKLGFLTLPDNIELVEEISTYTNAIKNRYESYVHIGIGGSALGPIALQNSLLDSYYNLENKPKMFFPDNVDPDWLNDLLQHIDVSKTLFHIVSKSGGTAETAATMLYFVKYLKKELGDHFYKNLLFTTDPVDGLLNQIAREYPIKCFRIPPNVGGRFSVLTAVGLISASIAGIDIKELMEGAGTMAQICREDNLQENPAFIYAAIHYLYMKKGKNISVMMPYSNKIRDLADWYRQLWAESLGKRTDLDGKTVATGQTPVKALGTTDQHSQVQLYVEGPNDKITTFLEVENFKINEEIENHFEYIPEFDYLSGKTLGELINHEKRATEIALTNNQKPNITIKFPEVNAKTIGQFFMLLETATAFTGGLLNINTFNQPGVEEGKIATYALMGRSGYDKKRNEILNQLDKKQPFTV